MLTQQVLYRQKNFCIFLEHRVVLVNLRAIYHLWSILNFWLWVFQNILTAHLTLHPSGEYSAAPQLQRNHFVGKILSYFTPPPPFVFRFVEIFHSGKFGPYFVYIFIADWNFLTKFAALIRVSIETFTSAIKLIFRSNKFDKRTV